MWTRILNCAVNVQKQSLESHWIEFPRWTCSGQEPTVLMWKWCKSLVLCSSCHSGTLRLYLFSLLHPQGFVLTEGLSYNEDNNPVLCCRATLKSGEKVCLDPNASAIKKIVMKILEGYWPTICGLSAKPFHSAGRDRFWNLNVLESFSTLKLGYTFIVSQNSPCVLRRCIKGCCKDDENEPTELELAVDGWFLQFLAKHWAVLCISLVEVFFPSALCKVLFLYFLNYFF